MRHFILPLLVLAAVACKPRDPDEAGLLSEDTTSDSRVQIARGGDWDIGCKPSDADGDAAVYALAVEGAVNSGDEAQELLVSVSKSEKGKSAQLVTKELGHGAVSEAGPLFVGFTSGVLTADSSNDAGKVSYTGVLTLASDSTEGLKVTCSVVKASRG